VHEHDRPAIIDRIDTLTEDAADWTATGEHTRSWWATPTAGSMTAVELNMTGLGLVDISDTDADRDIARRVGDPGVDRISHLYRVRFWVGGNSVVTSPVNTGATRFLHRLLTDVRDGHYVAGDAEREHARALLDAPGDLPVIHGPCLVTGVADGGAVAPLDENFHDWFTNLLNRLAQVRHALVSAIAHEIGIPPEQLGHVVLVALG